MKNIALQLFFFLFNTNTYKRLSRKFELPENEHKKWLTCSAIFMLKSITIQKAFSRSAMKITVKIREEKWVGLLEVSEETKINT